MHKNVCTAIEYSCRPGFVVRFKPCVLLHF